MSIEKVSVLNSINKNGWNPVIGEETIMLLNNLDLSPDGKSKLMDETVEILRKCGNPKAHSNCEIGLVFGYVQSGKTMSFTTLTALAKDNGYRIIIIIAGISTNLVAQSFTRLEKDLRIDSRKDLQWLSFRNPKLTDQTIKNQIENVIEEWKDSSFPEDEHKTIFNYCDEAKKSFA